MFQHAFLFALQCWQITLIIGVPVYVWSSDNTEEYAIRSNRREQRPLLMINGSRWNIPESFPIKPDSNHEWNHVVTIQLVLFYGMLTRSLKSPSRKRLWTTCRSINVSTVLEYTTPDLMNALRRALTSRKIQSHTASVCQLTRGSLSEQLAWCYFNNPSREGRAGSRCNIFSRMSSDNASWASFRWCS